MDEYALDETQFARLQRIGGDKLVRELLDLFLKNAPERLDEMKRGLATGDWPAVGLAAHSMKSKAANLGSRRLQELAAALEKAGDAAQEAEVRTLLPEFETELTRILGLLSQRRAAMPS